MFGSHVDKQLSAYCNGELDPNESRLLEEHLSKCERCRKEYDEIKFAVQMAEQIPIVSAPDSMWGEIESLLKEQSGKPAPSPRRLQFGFGWIRPGYALATASFVVAIGIIASLYFYATRESWHVEFLALNSDTITSTGSINVGQSLVIDPSSRARITVGVIGSVVLDPNSKIRLVSTDITEQRIALDVGRLEAKIKAPPRIFLVDTPSGQAIDLGCAYTLEVDDVGHSFLHVTDGRVALQKDDREVEVLRNAMCETNPETGPGAPFFDTASPALRVALSRFDFDNGGDEALDQVLAASTARDTYTLWHLLPRVNDAQRVRVYDRMVELTGPPQGTTQEDVLSRDEKALYLWWLDLYSRIWSP
jgi:hypothetical protein